MQAAPLNMGGKELQGSPRQGPNGGGEDFKGAEWDLDGESGGRQCEAR